MIQLTNNQWLWAGAAVVVGFYLLKKQAGEKLDITSDQNVVNQWVEGVYNGGFDGQGTPGTDLADINYEYSPYVLADNARETVAEWWADIWN